MNGITTMFKLFCSIVILIKTLIGGQLGNRLFSNDLLSQLHIPLFKIVCFFFQVWRNLKFPEVPPSSQSASGCVETTVLYLPQFFHQHQVMISFVAVTMCGKLFIDNSCSFPIPFRCNKEGSSYFMCVMCMFLMNVCVCWCGCEFV